MPTAQALDFQARTHATPRYATTAPQIRTAAGESRVELPVSRILDRPPCGSRTHGKPENDASYARKSMRYWRVCFPTRYREAHGKLCGMAIHLSESEIRLLKELKGAGEHGRS